MHVNRIFLIKNRIIRNPLFLFLILIVLTAFEFYVIYPKVYPYYQNQLFTVDSNSYFIVNWLCTVFSAIICLAQIKRFQKTQIVSYLVMFYLNLIYYIPGFLMCAVYKTDERYNLYYIIFWVVLNCFHYIMCHLYNPTGDSIQSDKYSLLNYTDKYRELFQYFIIGFIIAILSVSLVLSNMRINISSLFDQSAVLEIRAAAAENNIHWLIWNPILASSMFFPVWYTVAFNNKKKWECILIIVATCAMYTVSANRMFLFLLLFAVIITIFKNDDLLFVKCWIIVLCVIYLEYILESGSYTVLDIYRRLSLTPNSESRFYVDFFSNNELDWARQLLERWLYPLDIQSPYHTRIATLIGRTYLGGSNCNTGLLGYCFGNYGTLGLFLGPFLYMVSFWLLNIVTNKIRFNKTLHCLAIVYAIMVTNDYGWAEYLILPSFLLLYYVMLVLMPPQKDKY